MNYLVLVDMENDTENVSCMVDWKQWVSWTRVGMV